MKQRKVSGMERIKTMHSMKQRSIPRQQQTSEIELFLLEKEKERFVKEAERLQTRLRTVYERILVLNKEIDQHQQLRMKKHLEAPTGEEALEEIKEMIEEQVAFSKRGEGQDGEWKIKKLMY